MREVRRSLSGALCGAALALGAVAALWRPGSASPQERPFGDFVERDFPYFVTTLDAGRTGAPFPQRNLAVRCVVLMLGNESYACFDTDLLRLSAAWRGGFMSLTTMAQVSYNEPFNKNNQIPRVLGTPVVANGMYAGWTAGTPSFTDPRPAGPNPDDMGRGPIAAAAGRWNGVHVAGNRAVLSYTVAGTEISEEIGSVAAGAHVGITRTFRTGPIVQPLTLVVADVGGVVAADVEGATATLYQGAARDTATIAGVAGAPAGARLQVDSNRYVTLRLTAGPASTFRVVTWRGRAADRAAIAPLLQGAATLAPFETGGPRRWDSTVTTQGVVSPDTADYVVDRLTLPLPNPWRRNVRVSDVDFFADGRAAAVTFEGDVWIASGIDRALGRVQWRRFASGLYEPLNLQIVRDTIYVLDRQGIVRLHDVNADGEADWYENFSNLVIQSGESREYPLGFGAKPGGGFYLSIGGALDNGPKTSPQIMPGFRAGSIHSGTVQEVSADGRAIRTFATGLREPNIGVHPRTGLIASSDQQGNFVPSTPVLLLREGGYYGVPPTAHRADTSSAAPPLVWIPHEVDASGAGEVWVTGNRMGFDGDALVHLSYARPGPFRVYVDSTPSAVQGAIVPLPGTFTTPTLKARVHPTDGQLYLAGFQIWQSKAKDVSSLTRLRYTGRPSTIPVAVRAGQQGILVRFATRLDAATARDAQRIKLESWSYRRTSSYGSGHFKRDGSAGHDRTNVATHLSPDGRTLLVVVPDMRPVMQLQLDYDLRSATGAPFRNSLYLTVQSVDPLDLRAAGFGALDWRASARRATSATAATVASSSAAAGASIVQRVGCLGCHSIDGTTAGKTGPTLKGLYGSQRRLVGKPAIRADETYLTRSILDPAADVAQGFEPAMPSFRGVLSEAEVRSVVMYLSTLGGR
jgi:mono/diheme cytochrome c family protein/glucose/arabinose dehydrogenase